MIIELNMPFIADTDTDENSFFDFFYADTCTAVLCSFGGGGGA